MNAHTTLPVLFDQLGGTPPPGQWTEFGRPRQVEFLAALAATGSVRGAARSVGVGASTVYRARRADPAFRRAWNGALLAARPRAEDELAARAIDGVEEQVFYHGEVIATRTRYDSRLLLAHLARLDKLADDADAAAIADDFEAALAAFASEAELPSAAPANSSPGQCAMCAKSNTARAADGGARAAEPGPAGPEADEALVWCPVACEMVDPSTAQLNQMDAERPAWVLAPHELAGRDAEEVECAQATAYEEGEEQWYLALPPEDYQTGAAYRIADPAELARTQAAAA